MDSTFNIIYNYLYLQNFVQKISTYILFINAHFYIIFHHWEYI